MSQLYQTGTVGLFVGPQNVVPGAAGVRFVGYGKMSPTSEFIHSTKPIHTDLGGTMEPTDIGEGGEKAVVTVDLEQYNPVILEILKAYPLGVNAGLVAGAPVAPFVAGAHPFGSRGALLRTQQLLQTLFLVYSYMAVPAFAAFYPGQVPGRRFGAAWCKQNTWTGKALEDAQGVRVTFECIELLTFDASYGGTAGLPNWFLFDENVTGLAGAGGAPGFN